MLGIILVCWGFSAFLQLTFIQYMVRCFQAVVVVPVYQCNISFSSKTILLCHEVYSLSWLLALGSYFSKNTPQITMVFIVTTNWFIDDERIFLALFSAYYWYSWKLLINAFFKVSQLCQYTPRTACDFVIFGQLLIHCSVPFPYPPCIALKTSHSDLRLLYEVLMASKTIIIYQKCDSPTCLPCIK